MRTPNPWLIEVGLPGTPLRVSKTGWCFRSTGQAFRSRLKSIRQYPRYVVSSEDGGNVPVPEMVFECSDTGGALARLLEGIDKESVKGSAVTAYEAELGTALASSEKMATMVLVRVDWPEPRVPSFTCRVDDDVIQHNCPKEQARITADSFPKADPAAYDKIAQPLYGIHGSKSYDGAGFVKLICTNTTTGQYLLCIGRAQGVDDVYTADAHRLDPAMYVFSYGAVRGTWYTFVTLKFDSALADFSAIPGLSKNYGTAQGGDGTHITLADNASSNDNDPEYIGKIVYIYAGTGAGQSATIISYSGSTKVVEVAAWGVSPDATSQYAVIDMVGKTLQADARGYTVNADGTGALISNPVDQIAHFISNFVIGAWRRGAWLATSARIGASSLDQGDDNSLWSFFDDRGYVGARVVDAVGNGSDLIASWLKSFNCVAYWWTDGKLYFDVDDFTKDDVYNSNKAADQEHLDLPDEDDRQVIGSLTVRSVRDAASGQYMATLSIRNPDARTDATASIEQEWGPAL